MGDLLSFEDAIADSAGKKSRHLLLGNGFSIDWDLKSRRFDYEKLLDEAKFPGLTPTKKELFSLLDTSDFERAMEALDTAADLAHLYGRLKYSGELDRESGIIKDGLAEVLTRVHPKRASSVSNDEVTSARRFLYHFGTYFTLSYDLLLYWVLNAQNRGTGPLPGREDGFTKKGTDLVWDEYNGNQRAFYLHGAFHLYTGVDGETHKLKYDRSANLIDQVTTAISNREYPLIVTEGKTHQKIRVINNNPYLRYCRRVFELAQGSLFLHGVAMSDNDKHIFAHLENRASQISDLYVGVYGRLTDSRNVGIESAAKTIAARRREHGGRLNVKFYSTKSANVWRDNTAP